MKRAGRIICGLTFAMFFATTAFAANKGTLHVEAPTTAGTTQLPAGDYTVQWVGTGPDVQLEIKNGKQVKAMVAARVVPVGHAFPANAALVHMDAEGNRALREIQLSGKKFSLQIQPPAADMSEGDGENSQY